MYRIQQQIMPRFKNKTGGTRRLIVPFNADFNGTKEINIKEKYLKIKSAKVLYKAFLDFQKFIVPKVRRHVRIGINRITSAMILKLLNSNMKIIKYLNGVIIDIKFL